MNFGCTCKLDPNSAEPRCPVCPSQHIDAKLDVLLGTGRDIGKVSVMARGTMDIGKAFGIPPPMFASATLGGSADVINPGRCGGPIGFEADVYLDLKLGLDLVIFKPNLNFRLSVKAGQEKLQRCWNERVEGRRRRRWWSRRRTERKCVNNGCDEYIKGHASLGADIKIAGARGWASATYYLRRKAFEMHIGADVYYCAWCSWQTVVSHQVI